MSMKNLVIFSIVICSIIGFICSIIEVNHYTNIEHLICSIFLCVLFSTTLIISGKLK